MNLNIIPKILKDKLNDNNLTLYEYNLVKEDGNLILRIIIDRDEGVDINLLAEINEFLSNELDKYDADMPEYFLEVSSLGAERELKNKDDIIKSVGKYIHVELKDNNIIYEGVMLDANQDIITIRVNFKGRFKNIDIEYQNIKFIRLAVKF